MPLKIRDADNEKVVVELAAITGDAVTTSDRSAAEKRLQQIPRDESGRRLADELLAISARCSALPDLDTQSAEGILVYDERGLPT